MTIGQEILMLKAKLAEREKHLADLHRKSENFIILLRAIIDPFTEDATELDLNRAELTLKDFIAHTNHIAETKGQISKLERQLRG